MVQEVVDFWTTVSDEQKLESIVHDASSYRDMIRSATCINDACTKLKKELGFPFPTPPVRERLVFLEEEFKKSVPMKQRAMHVMQCPSGEHIGLDAFTLTRVIGSKFATLCVEKKVPFEMFEACPVCPRLAPGGGVCFDSSDSSLDNDDEAAKKTVSSKQFKELKVLLLELTILLYEKCKVHFTHAVTFGLKAAQTLKSVVAQKLNIKDLVHYAAFNYHPGLSKVLLDN
ncbi:hypothetical protein HDU96_010574 [Phlyctochytrium bullatum]|nr:hypothetical protein HDU96_010574 [Phlyctochytrium bullatum]